jgi:hypothetical protein
MTNQRLPTFIVQKIENDRAIGSFDDARWLGERFLADLLTPAGQFVCGRIVDINFQNRIATFVPSSAEQLHALSIGMLCKRFDGYWGERAALVLDRSRVWQERTFQPSDAVRFENHPGYVLGKSTNKELPSGGKTVKDGWDHEHCEICNAKISPHHDPIGVFSEPNSWICRDCYRNYVVPRSLDFIV